MDISTHRPNSTVHLLDPHTISELYSSPQVYKRAKRVHVFRPLFVYRQEKLQRQRINDERKFRNRQINNLKTNEIQRNVEKPCCNCNCDLCKHHKNGY